MPQDQSQPQTLAQLVRAKYPGAYDDIDDVTLEQRVLAKYPQYGDLPRTADPRTGAGMERLAGQNEANRIASQMHPNYTMDIATGKPQPGLPAPAQIPENAATMQAAAALGMPLELIGSTGLKAALPVIARGVLGTAGGAAAGGWGGREIGNLVGAPKTGEQIGAVIGGIAGGAGFSPKTSLFGGTAEAAPEVVPMTESPYADQYAAVRSAQKSILARNARPFVSLSESPNAGSAPIGAIGSATQEAGYQPAVTRVPIRPEPTTPLTPESVPGPDTSGKGNLLSPLARRGDQRAAMELARRGRNVLFVPDPASSDYIDAQKFSDLLDLIRNFDKK